MINGDRVPACRAHRETAPQARPWNPAVAAQGYSVTYDGRSALFEYKL